MDPVRGRFVHVYNKPGKDSGANRMAVFSSYQRSCFILRGVACMNILLSMKDVITKLHCS